METVVEHWIGLSKEGPESPSFKVLKKSLDVAFSAMVWSFPALMIL